MRQVPPCWVGRNGVTLFPLYFYNEQACVAPISKAFFVISKTQRTRLRPIHFALAALVALTAHGSDANAGERRGERVVEQIDARPAGDPVLAIVSLQSQRITIYDAKGWILRAPVSSGQRGRETPAGIFSVIQKDADHHSNLYDDASMPHMQRLTWSGIALHGGPLPGYPASHGCVRMPYDFAEHLFDLTQMGLRVIVAPTDVAPVEIDHPVLFQAKPGADALAAALNMQADDAARKSDLARRAAGTAFRENALAIAAVRGSENQKRRAETLLATADTSLSSATSDEARQQAEADKAQATAKVAELQTQLDTAREQQQQKQDALMKAREATTAAETIRAATAEAARLAARQTEPVSVLISRKTQRLYVRQGFEPVLDVPVTITDPDRPIGTHIFTAMERAGGENKLRWSVVSLEGSRPPGRNAGPLPAETASAKSALDRIVIPQDILDRIVGIEPRSSLIVTDEALSSETGKGTDFVVILSDEPQGGIKIRRRPDPTAQVSYLRSREGRVFGGPFSTW
jgi:L,D-transpeptidase catalytic domain